MADASLLFNILGRDGVSKVFRDIRGEVNKTSGAMSALDSGGGGKLAFAGLAAGARAAIHPIGLIVAGLAAVPAGAAVAAAAGAGAFAAFAGLGAFALRENAQVKQAFTGLKDHVNKELARIAAPLQGTFVNVANILRTTFDNIAPHLGRVFESIGPHIETLTRGFGTFVEKIMPALVDLAIQAGPLIDALAAGISGPLADGFINFLTYVADAMPAATVFMQDFFTVAGAILTAVGWLINDLATSYVQAKDKINAAIDAIVTWFRNAGQWISQTWNDIVAATARGVQWVINKANDIVRFFRELPGKIISAVSSFGSLLVSAGRNLVQGLINGIGNMAGAVKDKLMSIARGAWNSVLSFFGIHSPSREAIWAAQMIGAGLIRGFSSVTPQVTTAASSLGAAASPLPAMVGPSAGAESDNFADRVRDALSGMAFVIDESGGQVLARVVNRQNRSDARR